MITLIVCLFQEFIYVQFKKKQKTQHKYLINKTKKKWEKKIIKHIKWKYIPFNLLKITRKQLKFSQ